MQGRVARSFVAWSLVLATTACGGQTATSPSDVVVGAPVAGGEAEATAPPAPRSRDALDVAVRLVSARTGTLVHVESLRGNPLGPQLAGWFPFRGALEAAGIDLVQDFDRVLLVGRDPRQWYGASVFEHHIPREKLEKFATAALEASNPPGQRLKEGDIDGIHVNVTAEYKGRVGHSAGEIWLPTPTLIVVLPPDVRGVAAFTGSGGLPLPTKGEGISAWAFEPSSAFANPRVTIPDSISRIDAWAFPKPGGSVHVEMRGQSSGEDQAIDDARQLTREIDQATSIKVGPMVVRVFQVPPLRAEEDEVVGEIDVTRAQLDQLLAVASGSRPKY